MKPPNPTLRCQFKSRLPNRRLRNSLKNNPTNSTSNPTSSLISRSISRSTSSLIRCRCRSVLFRHNVPEGMCWAVQVSYWV